MVEEGIGVVPDPFHWPLCYVRLSSSDRTDNRLSDKCPLLRKACTARKVFHSFCCRPQVPSAFWVRIRYSKARSSNEFESDSSKWARALVIWKKGMMSPQVALLVWCFARIVTILLTASLEAYSVWTTSARRTLFRPAGSCCSHTSGTRSWSRFSYRFPRVTRGPYCFGLWPTNHSHWKKNLRVNVWRCSFIHG